MALRNRLLQRTIRDSCEVNLRDVSERNANLILWVSGKELAVEMGGENDSARSLRILSRDDIGELLLPVGCIVLEGIFFNVPIQVFQSLDKVLPHLGIIIRVR